MRFTASLTLQVRMMIFFEPGVGSMSWQRHFVSSVSPPAERVSPGRAKSIGSDRRSIGIVESEHRGGRHGSQNMPRATWKGFEALARLLPGVPDAGDHDESIRLNQVWMPRRAHQTRSRRR
jgi:hypothetical protein